MNNKELFQEKNDRLNENNNDLKDILEKINNLPNKNKINLQEKTISPTTYTQEVVSDSTYDGLSKVKINAVDSSIDSDIKPENIKKGVEILGVEGSLEQGAEVVKKYKPKHISFYGHEKISDLTEETRMMDTSLLTSFSSMFFTTGSNDLEYVDVSEWNTSNVTSFQAMCQGCSDLKVFDVSNWDTSNVTDMTNAFKACTSLESLDVSNWDTLKLQYSNYIFENCKLITSFDFSNWTTSNVTTMDSMFSGCIGLTELDLSSFTSPRLTTMSSMFYGCKNLTKIDMRNMGFEKLKYYNSAFISVPANCLIIVKDDNAKSKVLASRSDLTNVKTLAEYQAEGGV